MHQTCNNKLRKTSFSAPNNKYMKKLLFSISLLSAGATQAQVSIQELYLQSGAFYGQSNGSLSDFQTLAPQSSILQQDLSAYQNTSFWNDFGPGQSQSLGIGLGLAKLPNATLRLGLMHVNQNSALQTNGEYTEAFAFDTLTSAQTGAQIYIDSFSTHGYWARYNQKQLRLDASLIFRYKADKRWSFYGGIGVNFGLSYDAKTNVHQYNINWTGAQMYGYSNEQSSQGSHVNESFENKGGFGLGIYAPLGIDFQVGKKREFWKPIHLYMELRPGFNVNQIAGLGSNFSVGNFSNLGLRFKFK